jgi:hypothetical protein
LFSTEIDAYFIYGGVNGIQAKIINLDLYLDEEDNISPPGTPIID